MKRFMFAAALALCAGACSGERDDAQAGAEQAGAEDVSPVQPGAMSAADSGARVVQQPKSRKAIKAAEFKGELPPGAVRVQRVEIMDRNGFEKPMVASTVLIPAGWSHEGGIVWGGGDPNCNNAGYNVVFQASSPDGLSGVQIIPQEQWQWSNMNSGQQQGCPTRQISSVRQHIEYIVGNGRQGARVLDYRQRPDIEKQYAQFNQVTPMSGSESRSWVEAGEALIAYQLNGVDIRETVAVAVLFNQLRMQGLAGMPEMQYISGIALPGFAMRAPNGQLDFTLSEMIRKSGRPAPEWSARIAQHNAKIAKTNLDGARKRSQIISQTNEEIRQMQMDSWRKQNESSDYIQRETTEAIRGVETYNDPYYGGTVELDNTYDNAWQLDDGSYVLSNDAFFDPYKDLGVNATKLEVTQ